MRYAAILVAPFLAAGCMMGDMGETDVVESRGAASTIDDTDDPEATREAIEDIRDATSKYHDIDEAIADGYQQVQPCIEGPDGGGLGVPYARLDLASDTTWELTKPEVLFYHPKEDGSMDLVGSEPVVPIDLWEENYDEPPEEFGLEFHKAERMGMYGLHMWYWRTNQDGMFAFFHPKVSCEHYDG